MWYTISMVERIYHKLVLKKHEALRQITFSSHAEGVGVPVEETDEATGNSGVRASGGGTPLVNAVLKGPLNEESYQAKLKEAGHSKAIKQMRVVQS